MRNKFWLTVLLMSVFCLTSALVFAEDVYLTKGGKKYHPEGSYYLKWKETVKMTREEADAKGFTPSKEYFAKEKKSSNQETPSKTTKK